MKESINQLENRPLFSFSFVPSVFVLNFSGTSVIVAFSLKKELENHMVFVFFFLIKRGQAPPAFINENDTITRFTTKVQVATP